MASLESTLVDLGTAPPSNAYLTPAGLKAPEKWFPRKVLICELEHSERYATRISSKLDLGRDRHVAEVAANDGCLLQYFKIRNIPCMGVEPTASTAAAARNRALPLLKIFSASGSNGADNS